MTAIRQRSGSGRRGGMASVEDQRTENQEMFRAAQNLGSAKQEKRENLELNQLTEHMFSN